MSHLHLYSGLVKLAWHGKFVGGDLQGGWGHTYFGTPSLAPEANSEYLFIDNKS